MLLKNLLIVSASAFVAINCVLSIFSFALIPSSFESALGRNLRADGTENDTPRRDGHGKIDSISRPPEKRLVNADDYIYRRGLWDASPIVLESHKLIFFSIPKVSCTTFKQLFRRMMGYKNWKSQDGVLMLPHNPHRNGLKYLYDYSLEEANEMMTSPLYTRAVFVRDPKMRFLSAFLDKALSNDGSYLRDKCCPTGECIEKAQTLEGFLQLTETCQDTHWMPQSERMHPKHWKYINYVGHLENVENDTKQLLQKVGAWEDFGSSGWGKHGNTSIFENPADAGGHATWSHWQVWKWYTQVLERKVEAFYNEDYSNALLNFTRTNLVDY